LDESIRFKGSTRERFRGYLSSGERIIGEGGQPLTASGAHSSNLEGCQPVAGGRSAEQTTGPHPKNQSHPEEGGRRDNSAHRRPFPAESNYPCRLPVKFEDVLQSNKRGTVQLATLVRKFRIYENVRTKGDTTSFEEKTSKLLDKP
jgi:hypothetical protein